MIGLLLSIPALLLYIQHGIRSFSYPLFYIFAVTAAGLSSIENINGYAITLILLSVGAYTLGFCAIKIKIQSSSNFELLRENHRTTINIFFILSSLGVIIGLLNVIKSGGLSLILRGGRTWEYTFGFSTLNNYLYFLSGLCFVLAVLYIKRYGATRYMQVIVIVTFFYLLLHGVRGTVLFPVSMMFIILSDIHQNRYKLGYLLIMSLAVVTLFTFTSLLRSGFVELEWVRHLNRLRGYFLPNYENFGKLVEVLDYRTYGLGIFSTLLKPFVFVMSLGYIGKEEWYHIMSSMSVRHDAFWAVDPDYIKVMFLGPIYIDFGAPGVLVISFLFGVFSKISYSLRNKSMVTYLIYLIFCLQSLYIFWGFELIRTQFLYWIFMVWILQRKFRYANTAFR